MDSRKVRLCAWLLVLFVGVLLGPTLMAQAVAPIATEPSATTETQEWGFSVVWAFLGSSFLEWIKRHPSLSVISERTAWGVQRGIGVLLAIATALGVHVAFDPQAGVLTITGLLLPSMWQLGTESLRQFVFTEVTYRVAVKNYRRGELTA